MSFHLTQPHQASTDKRELREKKYTDRKESHEVLTILRKIEGESKPLNCKLASLPNKFLTTYSHPYFLINLFYKPIINYQYLVFKILNLLFIEVIQGLSKKNCVSHRDRVNLPNLENCVPHRDEHNSTRTPSTTGLTKKNCV